MIDPAQRSGRVSGLDFLDPGSENKSHQMSVADQGEWGGKLLRRDEKSNRMKFVHKVVDDLNDVLGPRNRKAFFLRKNRLGSDACNRLNWGMEDGALKIKAMLKTKRDLPAGTADRLRLLG